MVFGIWGILETFKVGFMLEMVYENALFISDSSEHDHELKLLSIFLPISFYICFTYVLGAQKNRLIETVLLSNHNICLV